MVERVGYYPICLSLAKRPCLVVGGGRVAQQKVKTLLRYGGQVIVVSPTVTPALRRWSRRGMIRWRRRTFRANDVAGHGLVYGATDDPETQQAIFHAARRRRILVNIVDMPARCSFIAPAQIRRGALTIAMTTGGRAPGLAKRVRKEVERVIGPEYAALLRLLERVRPLIHRHVPTIKGRKHVMDQLISGGVLEPLRRGHRRQALRRAQRVLRQHGCEVSL